MTSRTSQPGSAGVSTTGSSSTVTYQVPSPAGTVWLGLGAAQVAALAITLLITVGLMLTGAPLPVTLLVACAGAALSAWPLAGRTGLQWIPLLTVHTIARVVRALSWQLPINDLCITTAMSADPATSDFSEPDLLGGRVPRRLTLGLGEPPLLLDGALGGVAALVDPRRHTVTVVLATTPTGRFGLQDAPGQDASLQQWGSALGTLLHLADVAHVQWLIHTGPDLHLPDPYQTDLLRQDQAKLLQRARVQARRHTTLLSVTATVTGSGSRGSRLAGRRTAAASRADTAMAVAQPLAQEVASALLAADILSYPLSAEELTGRLRHLLDPVHPEADGDADQGEGPLAMSARSTWTHCATDDVLHRSFAVTGWPRTSLGADWLAGLLHQPPASGTSRTLTVQARPIGQAQAARRARAGTAKARLDAADRHRLGFAQSAAAGLEESASEQTEAELVAGYRMADVTALLTLHAPTLALLESASGQLGTTALTHRLELRPLHGQHQHALAATLPLGASHGGRA
jgi:hypothetical protein